MGQRFENRRNRGFSLVETLAVVAILVILLSISAVAASYYRDYLKITELDNAAREIYMAAENRAVLLDSSGRLEGLLSASTLAEGGAADSPWITKDDAAAKELLTAGAIDPALLKGDFRIVYDPDSFAVTDVFYAESAITKTKEQALSIAGDRDARMKETPMLGYYGGEQEARKDYTPLPAPEVMVVVENGDMLRVHVTFSVPGSALDAVGNWMFDAKQTQKVKLTYGGETAWLMNSDDPSKVVRGWSTQRIDNTNPSITYTWILDALDTVSKEGNTVENGHFYQLFDGSGMTYGDDFTVTAEFTLRAAGDDRRPTSAFGSDTGNSLFAEHSGGGAARLENLRHLQNLDFETSCVGGKTDAVQLNDIDCHGMDDQEDPAYGYRYAFRPIVNKELRSFDGGWTADEDGGNRRNEITDLYVTETSTGSKLGAGLFATTYGSAAAGAQKAVKFTGVRLIDAKVTASKPAGALVGYAGPQNEFRDILVSGAQIKCTDGRADYAAAGGVVGGGNSSTADDSTEYFSARNQSFQQVRVVNTSAVCEAGAAGGIAGRVSGASNCVSCQVYWEPEEGQRDLRSLLGSDAAEYNYQITGQYAGGLIGHFDKTGTATSGKDSFTIEESFASSMVKGTDYAGGLLGYSQSVQITAKHSYADCYLTGGRAAGLIGYTTSGTNIEDCYAAGFINMEEGMAEAAGLCLGSSSIESHRAYSVMSYPGISTTSTVYPLVQKINDTQGKFEKTYYLTASIPSSISDGGEGMSYDDMTADTFTEKMGGAFAFKTVSADTNPYNLQEKQTLNPPYSFPGLTGLPHYGDWRAYFKEPSLVYYEQDSNENIGFSGGNARELIGQLEEGVTIQKDGYAVALMKKDLPDTGSFKVTYTCLGEDGEEKKLGPFTYGAGGETLLDAHWNRTEGGKTVTDEYWLAPLPDELVIGEKMDSGEFHSPTTKDFYQYLRFTTDIRLDNGGTGSTEGASGEYFYNPHFAETVKPYVPEEEGKPFIDWEDTWSGEGKPPYSKDKAKDGIHQYITETLTPGNRPVSVSVRTPRHLFHLSQYEDYYNNARLAFQQGLRLNGGKDVYTGYEGLLEHEEGERGFQRQSPIGTQAKPFLGSYNGNCLPIQRVAFEIPLNDQNRICAGLFGSSGGTLQNIVYSLRPSEEDSSEQKDIQRSIEFYSNERETFLGALAGFNTLTGKMINCAVEGVNLTTQVNTADVYIGGLCGENAGLIRGSAAESAYLHVEASSYAQAYAGGLTGYNRGEIDTSYAVGRLAAEAAQENAPVTLAGFAGLNSGSISNSYSAMDLKPDGAAAAAYGFCGPSSGGRQSGTYYLDNGNFSYRDEAFLAKYEEGGSAQPLSYVELTAETSPVPGMAKVMVPAGQEAEDFFPYPTGAMKGAASWHYGDWPRALKLGTMGAYYWEELQLPGKPISYHVSLLAVDPGEDGADDKTLSKFSTLSTAHDQGGEVVRCGYGLYNKQGITVTLKDDTPFPLLYSADGGKGGLLHELYDGLEEEKKAALSSSGTQAYLNHQVDEALEELMLYELDKTGKTQFEFHSFHSYGLNGSLGGLYPDAAADKPNGTLTLFASSGQDVTVTFALNPFFADALAVELPGDKWTPAEDVPTFTRPDGGQKDQTKWSGAPGSESHPYGVRSIGQLQLIDWNSQYRNTSTVLGASVQGSAVDVIANFPYLSSGDATGKYFWKQSYDVLGEKEEVPGKGMVPKTYTPIAEYYDWSGGNQGNLTGWFGGIYNGGTYLIKDVNITGQKSSCAGLFGVVYNGSLENIVLYSSDGEGVITTNAGKTDSQTESRWFAMGGLAGVAGTSDRTKNAIVNCSIAGYTILAEVYTYTRTSGDAWGGNNIGGLVGSSHMNFSGCSAETNIVVQNAVENDNMRVGGLAGICLGSLNNCYAGGSITLDADTVKLKRNDRGIYVGGLVGGSYMKPLKINGDSNQTIGFIEDKNGYVSNTLSNCYSYVRLPAYVADRHDNVKNEHFMIKGMFAVGGAGEIEPPGGGGANHGTSTLENCYYLESESLSQVTAEQILNAGIKTDLSGEAEVKVEDSDYKPAEEYSMLNVTFEKTSATQFKNLETGETIEIPANGDQRAYYRQSSTLGKGIGLFEYQGKIDNKAWIYVFHGWLVDVSGDVWTYTTDPNYFKKRPSITGLTYEELAGMTDVQGKGADIYTLLNAGQSGVFSPVTTKEGDMSVPGKYSYPTKAHPELRDRDYPFPTVLLKDNGKYHVHYGDWPLKGFRRQSLFDKDGKYEILGGSPIGIDLYVNGNAPHQEYLVLTDPRIGGGAWSLVWDSKKKAEEEGRDPNTVEPIAAETQPVLLKSDEIPNIPKEEEGKTYYLFELTPKKNGTDILYITYEVGDAAYILPVTVHVTATVELRPNRLFMFPGDTLEIDVRAADKAGQALTAGGELTLDDLHCGSSGYLTGQILRKKAEGDEPPRIRFSTSVPEEELTEALTLGANAGFNYNGLSGGAGGDIRIEIIQPWKGEEESFITFEEASNGGGTAQVVCTISFPNSYAVGEEGTLLFERAGDPSAALMANMPQAEWIEEEGRIALKLTYPGGVALATGVPKTTVSIPLRLTSSETGGQPKLIEGEQFHTLTLTVEKPADTQADTQAVRSIEALPPGEDGQDNSARRRRWKRKHQRRRPLERKS